MHINSRSLPRNFDHITAFLNTLSTPPDILSITETWLSENNKEHFQLPGYHSFHLVRNIRTQGGVSVFVANSIKSLQIKELTILNDNIEINTLRITFNSSSYIICTIYRPHSKYEAVQEFTDTLCSLLQKNMIKNNNK